MCDEQTQCVEHTDVGVSISVELKRGSHTRDQEKLVAKAKGETLEEAREDMEVLKEYLHELSNYTRDIQPGDE